MTTATKQAPFPLGKDPVFRNSVARELTLDMFRVRQEAYISRILELETALRDVLDALPPGAKSLALRNAVFNATAIAKASS